MGSVERGCSSLGRVRPDSFLLPPPDHREDDEADENEDEEDDEDDEDEEGDEDDEEDEDDYG